MPVNADGRLAIDLLIAWHREKYKTIAATRPLFPSRNRNGIVPSGAKREAGDTLFAKKFRPARL